MPIYERSTGLIGEIKYFAGADVPDGWLRCSDGEASRADNIELFSEVGVLYGDGDGETTFGLPFVYDQTAIIRSKQ